MHRTATITALWTGLLVGGVVALLTAPGPGTLDTCPTGTVCLYEHVGYTTPTTTLIDASSVYNATGHAVVLRRADGANVCLVPHRGFDMLGLFELNDRVDAVEVLPGGRCPWR